MIRIGFLLASLSMVGSSLGTLSGQGRSENAETVEKILNDLQQGNYQVLRRAVLAARTSKDPALLDRLLHLAQHARHVNIRGYACETLAQYDDKRIFPVLAKAAKARALGARGGALRVATRRL